MVAFVKLINRVGYYFSIIKSGLTVLVFLGCLVTLSFFTLICFRLPQSAISYQPANAIVVLGGGLTNNQRNEIIINQYTKSRLVRAKEIFDDNQLPVIVSGKEAPWMAKWLQKNGVMWVVAEKNSFNTCQNAKYTAETVKVKNVVLVTDAYHMNRSRRQFAMNGIATIPSVAAMPKPTDWYQADQNLQHSRRALYELMAFARDLVKPQNECQPTK